MSTRYGDEHDRGSDEGSGSGTRIGSPIIKDDDILLNSSTTTSTTSHKIHLTLLLTSFLLSTYILFLTLTTAHTNNTLLSNLHPYAIDILNQTNTTWGYGAMPVHAPSKHSKSNGHHNGHPGEEEGGDNGEGGEGGTSTMTALDPEDTSILYSHMFPNGEELPMTVFPTTSDTIDEERPDEVVYFDTNFLVKPHVRPSVHPYSAPHHIPSTISPIGPSLPMPSF